MWAIGIFVGIAVLGVVQGAPTSHTDSFKSNLHSLQSQGNALKTCLTKVDHPLAEVAKFAKDVKAVQDFINQMEGRLNSVVDILDGVMLIPFVGELALPILEPAQVAISTINTGLKTVTGEIDTVANVIRSWLSPVDTIQKGVTAVNTKISQVVTVIGKAASVTDKVERCVTALPAGSAKNTAVSAMEHVCSTLDHIPNALLSPVGHVIDGCTQVEHFLSKLHLVRRKRSLPSLSKVLSVLKGISNAFGPVGSFLDMVNGALNKKVCLIGDLVKIGKEVYHGMEHVGEEIVKGAEHVGEQIVKGTEHVGEEIGKGVKDAANKVASGVKDAANKVGGFFHHLFGRSIDGRYYIIVDQDFDTSKRGVDLCFSINDALKLVNGVTGGILNAAKSFISKIFHGKMPFHIPGLTGDVLHLGSLLKTFHIPIPSVSSLFHLSESLVTQAIHLNPLNQFTQAIPVCKAAVLG